MGLCLGKPVAKGVFLEEQRPQEGVVYALRSFFDCTEDVTKAGLKPGLGKRIIVQGLGNVGYHAAKILSEEDETNHSCYGA